MLNQVMLDDFPPSPSDSTGSRNDGWTYEHILLIQNVLWMSIKAKGYGWAYFTDISNVCSPYVKPTSFVCCTWEAFSETRSVKF